MLQQFRSICGLNMEQLYFVYAETLGLKRGVFPRFGEQQAFFQMLYDFFEVPGAVYFVWASEGCYQSALRLEPYADGRLISWLETGAQWRRKGIASTLLQAVLKNVRTAENLPVYAHVRKSNTVSLRLHERAGFCRVANHARLLDGTVSDDYCTLMYK